MVFLVHLEVSKMAVTVYTSEEYADEKEEVTHDEDGEDSAELEDDGEEFSTP